MEKLLIRWSMTKKNESIRSFNSALMDDERFSISMVRLLMEMEKSYPSLESFLHHQHNANITWNDIQQDITARVERKLAYNVIATVRVSAASAADVTATLWVQTPDSREQYITIANAHVTDKESVVIYLEGPPPGVDLLVDSLVVKRAPKTPPTPIPLFQNADFGVNIIANSDLCSGTKGWFPLGDCGLSVAACGSHELLSGHCIHATNRTHTWMGPAQLITDKVKLFVTYQVSAWVRLVATGSPQNVNVALGVDDQWLKAGQVEADDDKWHEICGSFRIEKPAGKVMVYVQGPAPGISFMVARFQIFAVDRQERFRHLKHQTDKNSRRNRG